MKTRISIAFRRTSYAGIFILWSVTMAVLLFRHYGFNQTITPAAYKGIIPKELYEDQYILKEGIKPDKKFSMMLIDPATLSQEKITIEITGKEQIMVMGSKQEAFKLKGSFKGVEFFVWLTEKGEVLSFLQMQHT